MNSQVATTLARFARLVTTRPVVGKSVQHITKRGLFYTQRKRPSTPEENLVMVTGLGCVITIIGLSWNAGIYSIRFGMKDKPE